MDGSEGTMPNLVILQLPSDHTRGATPDYSTPKAMVADNDLALGQIVEALSKSPFWPKMAIFVVEDDAQNGVDHVDGHRTIALAISPYIRRGAVDSTFYAQQSMVKTIELMLGPADHVALRPDRDRHAGELHDHAGPTPTRAVEPGSRCSSEPGVDANARARCARRRWTRWRCASTCRTPRRPRRLNRIVWGLVRGWRAPYPGGAQGGVLAVRDQPRGRRARASRQMS